MDKVELIFKNFLLHTTPGKGVRRIMLFSQEERISLLLAFSFFLRIIFIFLYDISAPPVSWGDDFSYDHIAYQVVVNHSYENTWFPPGYPLFLALIYSIFDRNFAVVRLIQGFLGVVTCFITYLLGKKTFNEKTGLLAAFLLSCTQVTFTCLGV
jgi:4-amino-4-deoxy-L-arabinose transferase-like glycosyltransferase